MGDSRASRIQALFEQALDVDADAREGWLCTACADEPDLLAQVRRLLAHDAQANDHFLRSPIDSSMHRQDGPALDTGQLVGGHYRLQRIIGRGGMGVVWLAEQQHPRRDVALKVVRSAVLSDEVRRRFEFETHVLGSLKHPGIAQLFGAGVIEDPSGQRPFFAMEYVEGVNLLQHANDATLGVRARLELFVKTCDAVQHAHQKGVIHRDLKPANILVTQTGDPKVLDFGVARATARDAQLTTLHTGAGQLVGTLAYMSPEQVDGSGEPVDTRSDVYALGVILYELLVGRVPHNIQQRSIVEAARIICEQDPVLPGTVDRTLRGDLDTIVGKALARDPAHRYPSASDLGGDVTRFLRNEPIVARPLTLRYQVAKFSQRNRGLVAGLGLALVTLLLGVAATLWLAHNLSNALRDASEHQRVTQAVNDFLNHDVLGQAMPLSGGAVDITMREALDRAAETVGTRFATEPLIHASIRMTLGVAYAQMGHPATAAPHLEIARGLLRTAVGADDPRTLAADLELLRVHLQAWDLDAAERIAADTRPRVERLAAEQPHVVHGDLMLAQGGLGLRQGHFTEGEAETRRGFDLLLRLDDVPPMTLTRAHANLAMALTELGRVQEAEAMLHEVVASFRILDPDGLAVAHTLTNLGHIVLESRGPAGMPDAERCFSESLAIRQQRLGDDHPQTLRTLYSLAMLYADRGDHAAAERAHRKVWSGRLTLHPDDHMDNLASMFCIAMAVAAQQRHAEATELYLSLLDKGQRRYGVNNYDIRLMRLDVMAYLRDVDPAALERLVDGYVALLAEAAGAPDAPADVITAYIGELLQCEVPALRDPQRGFELVRTHLAAGLPVTTELADALVAAAATDATGLGAEVLDLAYRSAVDAAPEVRERLRAAAGR